MNITESEVVCLTFLYTELEVLYCIPPHTPLTSGFPPNTVPIYDVKISDWLILSLLLVRKVKISEGHFSNFEAYSEEDDTRVPE